MPPLSSPFLFIRIVAALLAHIAILYIPVMQSIFQTRPLQLWQWGVITLVSSSALIGGELDKLTRRRREAAPG